jgi:glycosyltransferase involved in cell wall biosynthesis
MFFSVLVPAYNAAAYLEECLDSALAQTERDYEIVVVDDGSTDGTDEICARYHALDPLRVRVICQQNRGSILARRAGIVAARGDFCVFLDADDTIAADTLETVRETIGRTGADIVIYNFYNRYLPDETLDMATPVFEDGTVFCGKEKRTLYEKIISSWRLNNLATKAIRTTLLVEDDTPFDEYADNPHMDDMLQSLYPITHSERIVYIAKPLYYYRRNNEGISGNVAVEKIDRQFNVPVIKQLETYMKIWGMDTPRYRIMLNLRKVKKMLTVFYQHYRAAGAKDQREKVIAFPWRDYIEWDDGRIVGSSELSFLQRVQIYAVLHRRGRLAGVFAWFGKLKLKRLHGD